MRNGTPVHGTNKTKTNEISGLFCVLTEIKWVVFNGGQDKMASAENDFFFLIYQL
jgi:hypothetical protein